MNVVLSSGGMDSFLAAHRLGAAAVHVFVDIGQPYREKELRAARRVAEVCDASFERVFGAQIAQHEHTSGIIPFRNAELILCAAQYGTRIYLGVLADEINSDKSPEFMVAMAQVLNISHREQYWTGGKVFDLVTPLRGLTKTEAVADYLRRGGPMGALLETVSCYSGGEGHCGRCPSCFKRWVALINNDLPRCWNFAEDPATWKTAEEWRKALASYAPRRQWEVTRALHAAGVRLD